MSWVYSPNSFVASSLGDFIVIPHGFSNSKSDVKNNISLNSVTSTLFNFIFFQFDLAKSHYSCCLLFQNTINTYYVIHFHVNFSFREL